MSAQIGEYRELPGPKAKEELERGKRYCIKTVQNSKLVLSDKGAHGSILYDVDGNTYLDFFAGAGVNNLGYGVDLLTNAAKRQMQHGIWVYDFSVFFNTPGIDLCEVLAKAAPGNVERKVFLASTGTEAVEAAIKIAAASRRGRKHWICFEGAFHGRTLGSLSFNASKVVHKYGFPTAIEPLVFPYPSHSGALNALFERLENSIDPKDIAAVILELQQGEGGVNKGDSSELALLNQLCEKYGIVRIVDEVQTGIGRTGTLFALEQFPTFSADIITVAKAVGGGLPLSATITDARLDFSEFGMHANTMGGNFVAVQTALAVMRYFQDYPQIFTHVRETGDYLHRRLIELQDFFNAKCAGTKSTEDLYYAPRLYSARGMGLMRAIDILYEPWQTHRFGENPRERVVDACFERGLIVESTGRHGVRFLPPLIVGREDIDEAMKIFEEALCAAFIRV